MTAISDAAVAAYEAAHGRVWRDRAPTTQGEAVVVARDAVRAGLAAALPLVEVGAAPVVVEHAVEMAGGGMHVRKRSAGLDRTLREWIHLNQRDGGRIHRRKVIVVDGWREVPR